jgi:hypothetical protein
MSLISSAGKVLTHFPHLKDRVKKLEIVRSVLDKQVDARYNYYANLDPNMYPAELARWYESVTGTPLDLENPQTFNEKIQWLKLYDSTPLKTRLTDKYLVREWITEKIGEEYLIPLLGVWDSFDEIDFDALPNQFVLKANHGSGWNVIVKDKATLDKVDAKVKFDKWMKLNFAYMAGLELHYKDIVPKIVAEKYIENDEGGLSDYKIHCFNGKPMYIQYIGDRAYHSVKAAFFDPEWRLMSFTSRTYPRCDVQIPAPERLNELLQFAEILAKEFIYVRVDFYVLNDGSFKFGEMTFTPASGVSGWEPPEYNSKLGELLVLPQ